MSRDVIARRESFELVVERSPYVSRRLYETLFERHPELRLLFSRSIERHEQNLARALVAVLARLEDAPWLVDTLLCSEQSTSSTESRTRGTNG